MTPSYCSKCGAETAPDAAFCSKCGLPFLNAQASSPAVEPMQNVGMLPTTKYALLGVWLLGAIICFAVAGPTLGWMWALLWSIGFLVVFRIWAGIRQAQIDLEWQRRMRR